MASQIAQKPKRGSWLLHGVPDLPDDGTKVPLGVRLAHHMRTRHFFASLAILLVIAIIMVICRVDMQWYWLILMQRSQSRLLPLSETRHDISGEAPHTTELLCGLCSSGSKWLQKT